MKKLSVILKSIMIASAILAAPVHAENKAVSDSAKPVAAAAAQVAAVNINTADAATLATALNGVGIKKAEAIVSYRQQHGAFKSVEELADVPGIGPATVEKNRSLITL